LISESAGFSWSSSPSLFLCGVGARASRMGTFFPTFWERSVSARPDSLHSRFFLLLLVKLNFLFSLTQRELFVLFLSFSEFFSSLVTCVPRPPFRFSGPSLGRPLSSLSRLPPLVYWMPLSFFAFNGFYDRVYDLFFFEVVFLPAVLRYFFSLDSRDCTSFAPQPPPISCCSLPRFLRISSLRPVEFFLIVRGIFLRVWVVLQTHELFLRTHTSLPRQKVTFELKSILTRITTRFPFLPVSLSCFTFMHPLFPVAVFLFGVEENDSQRQRDLSEWWRASRPLSNQPISRVPDSRFQ